MSLSLLKCEFCRHFFWDMQNKKMCCKAFPDGIPVASISDDEKAECANGIKFEGDSPYEFTPEPGSLLARMHRI